MFSAEDTIVAIATPPGRGALGIVRLAGPTAEAVALTLACRKQPFIPRHATLSTITAPDGRAIDQAIVTFFPEPASYTGEPVVEISGHGNPVVLRAIVTAALAAGARLAMPGEFTLRAFLNGRVDLAQAEAVGDLINASTPLQARSAFDQLTGTLTARIGEVDCAVFDLVARLEASVDFPDEGYHFVRADDLLLELDAIQDQLDSLLEGARRGRLLREGLQVAIVGAPNAGKSSLFNALVGADRAIVSELPGTTRDLVTEATEIGGIRITLVDTAGLRQTTDPVEAEGVARCLGALNVADLVLKISDISRCRDDVRLPERLDGCCRKVIDVATKIDLPHLWEDARAVHVSVVTGAGLSELRLLIGSALEQESLKELPAMTNVRHMAEVERAREAVRRCRHAAGDNETPLSEEFLLADLQIAKMALEEVTGRRTSEDLLAHIFASFCIGK